MPRGSDKHCPGLLRQQEVQNHLIPPQCIFRKLPCVIRFTFRKASCGQLTAGWGHLLAQPPTPSLINTDRTKICSCTENIADMNTARAQLKCSTMKTGPKWSVNRSHDLLYTELFIPALFFNRPYLGNKTSQTRSVVYTLHQRDGGIKMFLYPGHTSQNGRHAVPF